MTAMDIAAPMPHAAVPSVSPPAGVRQGTPRFYGSEGAFFGLLVRGSLLLLLTLGIYRFWLATDVRRFLWGNTEIAGDGLEYTGTAKELLIGFLMAIALLAPLNGLIFLATLAPGLLKFSGALGFGLLAVLGQFAVYRARRYRLSRTVFRGVRLYQTGSAWRYAIVSLLWWVLIGLTAGLAYPWAQANLERYKMRHTHYGNLDGRFEGSGTRLFLRGFVMWFIVVGPFLAGIITAVGAIMNDWAAFSAVMTASGGNFPSGLDEVGPLFAGAMVLAAAGLGWGVLAAALLYPVFRAMMLRWWLSGLRLGRIAAFSHLRTGQIYRVYLRFIGFSVLFAMAAGTFGGIMAGFFNELAKTFGSADGFEIAVIVALVAGYIIVMLGYSAIYQATVVIRFWRLSFETTELAGLEELGRVEARGEAASPFGEGLAGALDVGGL